MNAGTFNLERLCMSVWTCADRDDLHKVFSDIIARRRANLKAKKRDDVTDAAKNIQSVVDAAFALNMPEDTMTADLVAHFIVGSLTLSSRESAVLRMRCCDIIQIVHGVEVINWIYCFRSAGQYCPAPTNNDRRQSRHQ